MIKMVYYFIKKTCTNLLYITKTMVLIYLYGR